MSGQRRLFRTRRARQDLIEIWEHGAAENPPAADALLDDIKNACSRLIDHPRLVPARDDIRPGLRYLIVGDTVALHRIIDEGIDIIRVDGDEGGALLLDRVGEAGIVYRQTDVPHELVGGVGSPAGSCVWHVVGLQRSIREWAMRQGWGGRPIGEKPAQGVLIAALGVLAGWYGYGRQ